MIHPYALGGRYHTQVDRGWSLGYCSRVKGAGQSGSRAIAFVRVGGRDRWNLSRKVTRRTYGVGLTLLGGAGKGTKATPSGRGVWGVWGFLLTAHRMSRTA